MNDRQTMAAPSDERLQRSREYSLLLKDSAMLVKTYQRYSEQIGIDPDGAVPLGAPMRDILANKSNLWLYTVGFPLFWQTYNTLLYKEGSIGLYDSTGLNIHYAVSSSIIHITRSMEHKQGSSYRISDIGCNPVGITALTQRPCYADKGTTTLKILREWSGISVPVFNMEDVMVGIVSYGSTHNLSQTEIDVTVSFARLLSALYRQEQESSAMHLAVHSAPQPRATEQTSQPELNLATVERRCIEEALNRSNGNAAQAAELLGISKATLYRRIKDYNLNLPAELRK